MTVGNGLLRILAASALVAAAWPAPGARAEDAPLEAVWTRHAHEFHYAAFMSEYSCSQLEYKLRLLLRTTGARHDVAVTTNCIVVSGASPDATATVTFYTLAPKGPGAVAGGEPAGAAPQPSVDAAWRKVRLADHRPMELTAADCELVEKFRDQLLPMFTTRSIADRSHCRLGEVSAGDIDLQFEVLQARDGAAAR